MKKYKRSTVKLNESNIHNVQSIIDWCKCNLTEDKWRILDNSNVRAVVTHIIDKNGKFIASAPDYGNIQIFFLVDEDNMLFKLTWM